MVDSFKNLTSLTNSVTPQGDSLRKNLKAISSVSVSRATETVANANTTSVAEQARNAVGLLTDSIQLSADAIRSLKEASETPETREVAEENYQASTATPEDLEKVQKTADETGVAIQFRHDEALYAHGSGLDPERVFRLLAD